MSKQPFAQALFPIEISQALIFFLQISPNVNTLTFLQISSYQTNSCPSASVLFSRWGVLSWELLLWAANIRKQSCLNFCNKQTEKELLKYVRDNSHFCDNMCKPGC